MVTAITVVCSLIRTGTRRCYNCCICNVWLQIGSSKVCFLSLMVYVVIGVGMYFPQSVENEEIKEVDIPHLFWMYLTPCL